MSNKMTSRPKIIFTDFDGTIKPPHGQVAASDLAALRKLGRLGVIRVVATGRSLYSFARDYPPEMEFDYLIFSSGLGLCPWNNLNNSRASNQNAPAQLIFSHQFSQKQIALALKASIELGRGFFAFQPPPNCHCFVYLAPEIYPPTQGFLDRLQLYAPFAIPYNGQDLGPRGQFLITAPFDQMPPVRDGFEQMAPGLSLTYSSSPYGDRALWLEIFPPNVSKGSAAKFLAESLGLTSQESLAIGNDYNDLDLLAWSGQSYLTSDASPKIRSLYPAAPASPDAPLSWLLSKLFGV
jgi:hydroxymethylpyrimidine pyrophosphatase-like HAD family hydrolase